MALDFEIRRMIQDDMHVLFRLQCDGLGHKLLLILRGFQNPSVDETDGKFLGLLAQGMFKNQFNYETTMMFRFRVMSTLVCCKHLTNTILTLKDRYENITSMRFKRKYIS